MKLLFENWRKYLQEIERPGPGHTNSRYEQATGPIAFDGFAKAVDAGGYGNPGGFLEENKEDEPTSHPYPSHLQSIPGAYGKFKTSVDNLIENFHNREDFINELWKLYRASDVTHLQASEIMSDIMDKYNLPDDIDDAVLDFVLELTGPMANWPKEENI